MSRLISIYRYMRLFSQRRKKTHIAIDLNQSVICHVMSNLECHVLFENTKLKWSSGVNFEYKIFNIFFFSDLLSECEDEQDQDNALFQPDEEAPPDLNDKPLFSGAKITLSVSLLLISSFILRHGLSGTTLQDLLVLVQLHLATPNMFQASVKFYKQFFEQLQSPAIKHYYCRNCETYHGIQSVESCPKCGSTEQSFFLYMPLADISICK